MKRCCLFLYLIFVMCGCAPKMIPVDGGIFQMGSNNGEDKEKPLHSVMLDDYYISEKEVSHADYIKFLNRINASPDGTFEGVKLIDINAEDCAIKYNGRFVFKKSKWVKDKKYPVVYVTWYGAVHYCNWLSKRYGLEKIYTINDTIVIAHYKKNGYRLPTEAEWEFAAKGGNKGSASEYSGSDDYNSVAWHSENSDNRVHEGGELYENELGLYDMSGNVYEWCWDWYSFYYYSNCDSDSIVVNPVGPSECPHVKSLRTQRGGSWHVKYDRSRVTRRGLNPPHVCSKDGGFRLARGIISNANNEPKIQDLKIRKTAVERGDTLHVICNAIDHDDDVLAYLWYSSAGDISGNGKMIVFKTPLDVGNCTICCEVSDNKGGSDTKAISLIVVSTDMVYVNGGTYKMGSTSGQASEIPVHSVTLSDFEISRHEVTQSLYHAVMDTNPSCFLNKDNPVENITWYNAVLFCNKLSNLSGLKKVYSISDGNVTADFTKNGFRLPTEAEWEYAARGGKNTRNYIYSGSDVCSEVAWYENHSNSHNPVGKKLPNELGIYDMSGNIAEYCWDWFGSYSDTSQIDPTGPASGVSRVCRGGGVEELS